jgi:hypothetical protein
MGEFENQSFLGKNPESAEILNPCHFYAAYVFDQANEREHDIQTLIEQAQGLGYPVRY